MTQPLVLVLVVLQVVELDPVIEDDAELQKFSKVRSRLRPQRMFPSGLGPLLHVVPSLSLSLPCAKTPQFTAAVQPGSDVLSCLLLLWCSCCPSTPCVWVWSWTRSTDITTSRRSPPGLRSPSTEP